MYVEILAIPAVSQEHEWGTDEEDEGDYFACNEDPGGASEAAPVSFKFLSRT